jgi:hypothetical protein
MYESFERVPESPITELQRMHEELAVNALSTAC